MKKKVVRFTCSVGLVLASVCGSARPIDSAAEIRNVAISLKQLRNVQYDYIKKVQFPNGEKDQLKGKILLDNDNSFLLNDCDAFTLIYGSHWFYRADHRKKTLQITSLEKDRGRGNGKKQKKATEKDIFQNGAVTNFLDSVLLKKGKIKDIKKEGELTQLTVSFPSSENVRSIIIAYSDTGNMPLRYELEVFQPWRATPKGVEGVEAKIICTNFSSINEKTENIIGNFFIYKKGRIELKKYKAYKLLSKA
jgi:hypothetical protein